MAAAESRRQNQVRTGRTGPRVRAIVWGLHFLVMALALGSLLTHRFDLWIDLRMLGGGAIFLEILWVGATVLVPFCAGPWVGGWIRNPRWLQAGFSPAWAQRLLWPTYLVLACLVANLVYYCRLIYLGLEDWMLTMPLLILLLLSAWVLLTRHWLRHHAGLPAVARATRGTQLRAAGFAMGAAVIVAGAFLVHMYSRPPMGAVDLAVVLGGRIDEDGVASVELANRTRVAIDLYQRGLVRHILLSGGMYPPRKTGGPELSEPLAMKKVCLDAGIPEAAISLDPVGVNTKATAFNTRAFMRVRGYQTVVACSSNFHLYRTAYCFRELGIDAFTAPAQDTNWRCASLMSTTRELVGLVVYKLFPSYRVPKALTMQLAAPRVIVRKTAGVLELYDGPALVKSYTCISGGNGGDKTLEGDRKTPIGSFHIVYKNPESKFHLSLGLDYPNREDADRGLASGLITQAQYQGILEALQSDMSREENQKKLWYTPLGGEIFLHGHAEGRTGTAGCIALANPDIEELYTLLPVGTPVEIRP